MKSYTELCTLPTYEERLEYLQLHGEVGRDTFGFDRWLNQDFYQSREWRQFRDRIIARDMGCDLGCKDHPITDWVLRDGKPIRPRISIHHINPITKDDVLQHSEKLLDPENAICVSAATHKAIHYGTGQNKNMLSHCDVSVPVLAAWRPAHVVSLAQHRAGGAHGCVGHLDAPHQYPAAQSRERE